MRHLALAADPKDNDVTDPYRRGADIYEKMEDQLAPAILKVLRYARLNTPSCWRSSESSLGRETELPSCGIRRRGQDAEPALGLHRIDGGRQMVGFGARLQLLQRGRLHPGVTDIHHQPQPFTQMVGPLHHHVQRLDAALRHMTVRGYFRLAALEIESGREL